RVPGLGPAAPSRRGAPRPAAAPRAHLRAALPEYMAPAAFAPLDALPVTPQGKLDRARLLDLATASRAAALAGAVALAPPSGRVEVLLARLWREVLELPGAGAGPGAEDNFFDLGGGGPGPGARRPGRRRRL